MIKFDITLTWSKINATLMLVLAFVLDLVYDNSGTIFMFSLSFVVVLITGKQINDRLSENNKRVNTKDCSEVPRAEGD